MALSQRKREKVERNKRLHHVRGFNSYPDHQAQLAIQAYVETGEVREDDLPLVILERIRGRA